MTSREMLTMIREILGKDVAISFKSADQEGHYLQTPYNYTPRLGRRLTRSTYIDLGLGLLECLKEIDQSGRAEQGTKDVRNP